MNLEISYIIYSIVASCCFIWIFYKSKNKFSTGLITFWIISFPILNRPDYMIRTPWDFDLYPTRIFFLIGSIILVLNFLRKLKKKELFTPERKIYLFEFFLIAYIFISVIVIIIKSPGFREMVPLITNQLVFGIMYFISRDLLSKDDRSIIETLLVVFGVGSVIISLIQFFVDPEFFRISSERLAFSTYTRANGFMLDEFDNGLFLTILTSFILFQNRVWKRKLILCVIFGIGVLLTMHRGSWVIFCCTIILFIAIQIIFRPKKIYRLVIFPLYLLILVISILFLFIINSGKELLIPEDFIYDQLFRDSLLIRLDLAKFGVDIITRNPEGIGDFSFSAYGQLYYEEGLRFNQGYPLIIHNGFIGSAVKYGYLGGIIFILFTLSIIDFTLKKNEMNKVYRKTILLIVVSFIMINLTQEFSSLGSFPILIFSFFLGSGQNIENYN